MTSPPCVTPQEAARRHFLRRTLLRWRQAAAEARDERASALRGALTSNLLLLRRAWRGWRAGVEEERREAAGMVLAQAHHRRKLLAASWRGWGEWTAVCRGMGQRRAARLQATALQAWRAAVKAADKR